MPEFYPGEHLQAAHVILTGSEMDSMYEHLKIIVYQMSNALPSAWTGNDWEPAYKLISNARLLESTASLRDARDQSLTVKAFTDNVFRSAVDAVYLTRRDEQETMKILLDLIKWFLSGAKPKSLVDPKVGPCHASRPGDRGWHTRPGRASPRAQCKAIFCAGAI